MNRYKGELLKNFLHVVREFVKIVKGFTIPRAKVNRSRTPQEALDTLATMEQQVDPDVMTTMPGRDLNEKTPLDATADRTGNAGSFAETIMRQNPGEGDMFHFFQMEHEATDDEIAKKFTSLGLRPADAYELCRINEENSDFAYKYPNATIWKVNGVWHFMACYAYLGKLYVRVKIHTLPHWRKGYWMVGVPLLT